MPGRLTAPDIRAMKGRARIVVLTAYDACSAQLAERGGADVLLVGDSLGMVVLGHDDTLSVTMDDMVLHSRSVSRAATRALVVADMPFGSYHEDVPQAVRNAVRLMAEGGARAVKVEGAAHLPAVKAMIAAGVPVMGHLGLTPQRVAELGGYKVQGRTADAADAILREAASLAEAGCFALVLECVPSPVAERISAALPIPTIGIGAGPSCDGQVLVFHDVLGLYDRFTPRFVKRYAELGTLAANALSAYAADVRSGAFPAPEHGYDMSEEELDRLYGGSTRGK
ncbi:3-methyl-2-oxobutanoate hydroxymethyltransferase [Desulfovibrio sp. X2]|uniref:3-methyl-2-oxobutanoate hydroxymethyltransferase n=1 Tax=Desulfovibrio sp. X2 TaxID=941449 RepID=UPI000358AAA4|nr:3-methyl-2-oxobutanoate hydroxymethyltransferase [Desulfovibrio sp. X2]EPR43673.1 3-methyl-2-oxobutanoate hydroxymethyltransferase [Desulfovibrio sp. X2]